MVCPGPDRQRMACKSRDFAGELEDGFAGSDTRAVCACAKLDPPHHPAHKRRSCCGLALDMGDLREGRGQLLPLTLLQSLHQRSNLRRVTNLANQRLSEGGVIGGGSKPVGGNGPHLDGWCSTPPELVKHPQMPAVKP